MAAIALVIFAVILTPGLGMLAIIAVPLAFVVIGSVIAERRIRRRRRAAAHAGARAARR